MRKLMATFILGWPLLGCQTQSVVTEPPQTRTYAQDTEAIWPVILAFLQQSRLDTVEVDQERGLILARREAYQDQGWAFCQPARVIDRHDDKNRRRKARPVHRDARLEIRVSASGSGTLVTPLASFTEVQLNPFRNLPFTTPCLSKGSLETGLLDAIDAGR